MYQSSDQPAESGTRAWDCLWAGELVEINNKKGLRKQKEKKSC